jgi:Flp pilus assembly protein TadG
MTTRHPRVAATQRHDRGQALVEFVLIFPIFLLLVIGLIEFGVAFGVQLNVNYASRDAALLAAEAGNGQGADCVILSNIEATIASPSSRTSITQVRVFWSDANGVERAGKVNVYVRSGSTSCTLQDGTVLTVPYSLSGTAGYPEADRCAILAGCPGGHATVDQIGVTITYRHQWITPLPAMVTLPTGGVTVTRSNAMRMEPIL